MELIQCENRHFEPVLDIYQRVVKHLNETVNYPKWTEHHPSKVGIAEAIQNGEMYACTENEKIIGAVVLSENPEGEYTAGDWKKNLQTGEYLVIHMLAVDPLLEKRGIGGYIVERCAELAKRGGYQALRLDVVPDNFPAIRLYQRKGFLYAGTKDLRRNIPEIPVFDLYELNF